MKASLIEQEEMRLALLRDYNIMDSAPEADFDEIVELVKQICDVPVALISLVDEKRQWFKARKGTDITETPVEMSICAHAIASGGVLEIEDATADIRTADNPMITGEEAVRFYAGALLTDAKQLPLGTLCVLDRKPRRLTPHQKRALEILAGQAMRQIELRRALADAEVLRKEVDHRVKNSLQSLEALIRLQMRAEQSAEARAALDAVQGRLATISSLHEALYLSDAGAIVDISTFLSKVVHSAGQQMPDGVQISRTIAPADLSSRAASSIGMIVNEVITNAAKYAYEGREGGTFSVLGRRHGAEYRLTCSDDGPGYGDGPSEGSGLGMRIMRAAAQQLGGELTVSGEEQGARISVVWPLERHG